MSTRPAEILRLRLRCDASAPRLARRAVERLDVITPVRADALLVTSELAANAVLHSGSEPGEEIELKAELLSDGVRIGVRGEGRPRKSPTIHPPNRERPGGLGLRVIESIARRWGSERNDGLSVWVELALWTGAPSVLRSAERARKRAGRYDRAVPDRLYFTESDEANALLVSDPMALLIGFALDQQVSVQKAFSGPLELRERLGTLDPAALAAADLDPVFRARPAIHRFPGAMAKRVQELAAHVRDNYGGDASRIWADAPDSETLRANLAALPGFGEMKIKALGSVLAKRLGIEAARDLVPWHPTLGDVDSAQALADYQAAKRAHKAEWLKTQARA